MDFSIQQLLPYVTFKTSRSGGKGGQNVNKVSTKVELNFDFKASGLFSEIQIQQLLVKLQGKLTADGRIQIVSEKERSQYLNKESALQRLVQLLKIALHVQKARKATKPGKGVAEKRLKAKHQQALKKINRKTTFD